ncbi:hypothetical protein [Flagellimonas nanhaiensis]|uniref:Uncharacterized protein n=1 Tax=Flagellimonas nanhaiensis TaxID=2292706 RepID=A0A371JMV1_9FLAO|nr:hypothetical protein [Allomuricauda nanhaiensis]RDY58466.1 hypothetical protein DX873_15815 [Allomuricauda nanhaiensis]
MKKLRKSSINIWDRITGRRKNQLKKAEVLQNGLYKEVVEELKKSLQDDQHEFNHLLAELGQERARAKEVRIIFNKVKKGELINDLESMLVGTVRYKERRKKK